MFYDISLERETKDDHYPSGMIGTAPQHVTVIQSTSLSNDQEAFEKYLGFQVEQQEEDEVLRQQQVASSSEAIILMRDDQSVVLVPVSSNSSSPKASNQSQFSILLLNDSILTSARAASTDSSKKPSVQQLPQVEWNSVSIQPKNSNPITITAGKMTLSSGHVVVVSTPIGWRTPFARTKLLQYATMKSQPKSASTTTSRRPSIGSRLITPLSKRKVLKRQSSSTSESPPDLNPLSSSDNESFSKPSTPRSSSPTNSDSSNNSGIKNNNRTLLPSVDIRALTPGGEFAPFAANSQIGVPVESDLFVGSMMLLIRPTDPTQDPYWNERIFSKKKRLVIMYLQGRLKYVPEGPLYAGLEITQPMKLGLMASGLCSLILTFIQKFDSGLHYSFGDEKENAHMTSLAECFFDQLVVTPPGERPPKLGTSELNESPDLIKARKSLKHRIQWNTEDTYSMAFHTMYVDFPSWTTSNIPLVRDMKLQTFWANSFLKIVLYEPALQTKRHNFDDIKYIMSLQLKYLQPHERKNIEDAFSIGRNSSGISEEDETERGDASSAGGSTMDDSLRDVDDEVVNDDDSEEEFFDTVQVDEDSKASLPNMPPTVGASFSPAFVLSVIDEYCPMMIEMHSEKRSYETIYVFRGRYSHSRPIFRNVSTTRDALADCRPSINEEWFSPRLTEMERTRRILALMYMKGLTDKDVEIQQRTFAFQTMKTPFDRKFLKGPISKKHKKNKVKPYFAVARALSDHHWVEERALLTDQDIEFFRVDKKKASFSIGLSSIIKVTNVDSTSMLQGYYHILAIETFGRTTYLMFPSKEERFRWSQDIEGKAKAKDGLFGSAADSLTNHLIHMDDPSREFLHRSTMFDCSKRKILNCRQFRFQAPKPTGSQDTLLLAEHALVKATSLQSAHASNDTALTDFLDCAAALKDANARDLNDEERLAFFLNVYHVVIMHAFIVLGPPKNGLEWLTYFGSFAYQVSDDVFSLTELEHNIIRAKMNFPSQFFSRFVMPRSRFGFALRAPDVRINFALNSGSLSMPSAAVPIYQAETLNEQLDETVLKFVRRTVFFHQGKKDVSVTLPKICQWFASDFGDGSTSDILRMLQPYLDQEKQATLEKLWNARKEAYDVKNVKFLPFLFECRFLTLYEKSNNYSI